MEKNQDQVIKQTVNRIVELFHPSRAGLATSHRLW